MKRGVQFRARLHRPGSGRFARRHRVDVPGRVARAVGPGRGHARAAAGRRDAGSRPGRCGRTAWSGRRNTVRGFVESLRKAKRDPRITSVLLMPSASRAAVLGQGAGAARRGARFPPVGQDGRRLPRVRRRSRVLPRQRRRPGVPAADQPARSDRRRLLRDLPARDARQDRRVSGLPAHRRLQDGASTSSPRRASRRRTARCPSRSTATCTSSSFAGLPRRARRPSRRSAR